MTGFAKEEIKLSINLYKINLHKISKLVISCIILTLISYVFLNNIFVSNIYAAQTRESYSSKINNYPGYKQLIDKVKQDHPNWSIKILYTGLNWYDVIKNETTALHGRNVVPSSRTSAWKCSICGNTPRGGSSWRCASEAAVSYYMDPRNWINDSYIFQFENLAYNGDIQTLEGVKKIISNVKYMQGDTVTYTNTAGQLETLNKSYAQIIMDAAKAAGISPYHLASRLKQEQGINSPGATATGTYGGYVGYYNFLNIKASGSTDAQVIANGLEHAKSKNWTNPEISIIEGAKVLAKDYIKDGQDTLYLQKFDVDSSDGTLYYFQYMQNASAALTEGTSVRDAYKSLGMIDSSIEFVIPVYENMPETICSEPIEGSIVTQNVKVKGMDVSVRTGASTSSTRITFVNTGDVLLRIEKASTMNGQYYWDKVVLPDGRQGYIARAYLVDIADIVECNEKVVTTTDVYLRNGPGITGTTVVTLLAKGQELTKIETNKYNVDGYVWDRVKLADGRQGYIAQKYITGASTSNQEPTTPTTPSQNTDTNNTPVTLNDKDVKIDGINLICVPNFTVEVLKNKCVNNTVTVKDANGTTVTTGNIGTGYKVTIDNTTYTAVKLGDVNGDGKINSGDSLVLSKQVLGTASISGADKLKAADVNKDGKINSGDTLVVRKQILGTYQISL